MILNDCGSHRREAWQDEPTRWSVPQNLCALACQAVLTQCVDQPSPARQLPGPLSTQPLSQGGAGQISDVRTLQDTMQSTCVALLCADTNPPKSRVLHCRARCMLGYAESTTAHVVRLVWRLHEQEHEAQVAGRPHPVLACELDCGCL